MFSVLLLNGKPQESLRKLIKVCNKLLYDVWSESLKNLIDVVIIMDVQIDSLGKIQTEDSHNRLCVNHISSGYQIKISIEVCYIVYKCLNLVD